jgi:hypothetical protein
MLNMRKHATVQDSTNSNYDFIRSRYLFQQLVYLVDNKIFLIASKIGESLESYQEYAAKTVGKQKE